MRILISGGSGLVGSSIKELVTDEHEHEHKHDYIFLSSIDCDLRNENAVNMLFSKNNFDLVIHLAAKVGGLYANIDDNYNMLIDNIKINTNILENCKKYNVKRLINILSTCIFPEENSSNNLVYPLTSDQILNGKPHNSNSGYAHAKRMLHVGSKLLSNTSNIEIINLIPTNLVGKNDNYNIHNSHVIPGLVAKVYLAQKNNKPLIIKGQGFSKRQFVYSEDLGKIILHFIDCKLDKQFNPLIVGPQITDEITIKELVNKIVKEFDFKGEIIYDSNFLEGQHKKTIDDSELLTYIPDFKFTPLDIALKKTIEYFIVNYETVRK